MIFFIRENKFYFKSRRLRIGFINKFINFKK